MDNVLQIQILVIETYIRSRANKIPNESFVGFKQSADAVKSFTIERRTSLTEEVPDLEVCISDFRESLEHKRKEVYSMIQETKTEEHERKKLGVDNSSLHLQCNVGD